MVHLTRSTVVKFVLLQATIWSKNGKKLSPSKLASSCSGLEKNEDYRINPCAKEILAHIWDKNEKLTRILFEMSVAE